MDSYGPAAWSAAVMTVLAAVFAFIKWLFPFLRDWERARAEQSTRSGFLRYQDLYSALQAIEVSGVPRAIVFAGHNSGGVPRPGSPFYVSALHWNISERDKDYPLRYQNLPVDVGYISILAAIMTQGEARHVTEEMPPCQLKAIYEAEGVTDSILIFLGVRERKIHYMSAAVFEGRLTDSQITEVRLQANRIRNLLDA